MKRLARNRLIDSYLSRSAEYMGQTVDLQIIKQANVGIAAFKAPCVSDADGIMTAGRLLREFIDSEAPDAIVFDFEGVKFFSSQVLGLLLDVRAKLQESGGQVVIAGINPQLHRVFKITNLDKIFRFFANRSDAIQAIAAD